MARAKRLLLGDVDTVIKIAESEDSATKEERKSLTLVQEPFHWPRLVLALALAVLLLNVTDFLVLIILNHSRKLKESVK